MAIIDDNTTHQDTDKKIQELKAIDINDSSLPEGAQENLNPDADAWERACPPPDGVYQVKIHPGKKAFEQGKTDNGDVYYVANLECKILDNKDWEGIVIFAKVSTFLSAGKEISTMAGLIRKMGVAVPRQATHLAIVKLLNKCLKQEPKLYVEGEWKAWDMPKGEWIKTGMKNFPKTEDGKGFRHVVRDSKGGEVTAKWKPVKWYGNKEYREMIAQAEARKATSQGSKSSGSGKGQGEVVSSKDEFVEVQVNSVAAAGVGGVKVSDEDFVIEE